MQANTSLSKNVMQALKSLLKRDPILMKKYVKAGLVVVDSAITPLNGIMKHLLVVQDISPNTVPGERARRELETALMESFNKLQDSDFEDDYDFSWVDSRFKKTASKLEHLNLTKEKFKKMTDVVTYEQSPFSASQANKWDSNAVEPVLGGRLEESIGTPFRKKEDRIFNTEPMKEHQLEKTLYEYHQAQKEAADLAERGEHLRDLKERILSPQEVFDPRDPTLAKLEDLVKRVENKVATHANATRDVKIKSVAEALQTLTEIAKKGINLSDEQDEKDEEGKVSSDTFTIKSTNTKRGTGVFRRSPHSKKRG